MGMKIHLKIQKIEQILPKIWTFFKKLEHIVYHGRYVFRIIFKNMSEGSRKDVRRRKSLKDVGSRKSRKISSN